MPKPMPWYHKEAKCLSQLDSNLLPVCEGSESYPFSLIADKPPREMKKGHMTTYDHLTSIKLTTPLVFFLDPQFTFSIY